MSHNARRRRAATSSYHVASAMLHRLQIHIIRSHCTHVLKRELEALARPPQKALSNFHSRQVLVEMLNRVAVAALALESGGQVLRERRCRLQFHCHRHVLLSMHLQPFDKRGLMLLARAASAPQTNGTLCSLGPSELGRYSSMNTRDADNTTLCIAFCDRSNNLSPSLMGFTQR